VGREIFTVLEVFSTGMMGEWCVVWLRRKNAKKLAIELYSHCIAAGMDCSIWYDAADGRYVTTRRQKCGEGQFKVFQSEMKHSTIQQAQYG
jgi:hypothetical protein